MCVEECRGMRGEEGGGMEGNGEEHEGLADG